MAGAPAPASPAQPAPRLGYAGSVRFSILALFAAWLPAQTLRLPASAAAVKWMQGHAICLGAEGALPLLAVYDRHGRLVRTAPVRGLAPGVRQAEVKDFVLGAGLALHVSLAASFPLGRSARLLCTAPAAGPPHCLELGEVLCFRLAEAPGGSLWCFGPALDGMLLHRVTGPAAGPRLWLPEKAVRLLPDAAGTLRPPHESGPLGLPWLGAPRPGRLLLFVPNAAALYDVDLQSGAVAWLDLPPAPPPRSLVTFAAEGPLVLALFPLTRPGEQERLDTPYGLFVHQNGWRRAAPGRQWRRGAALAGAEAGAAWVWDRASSSLECVRLD